MPGGNRPGDDAGTGVAVQRPDFRDNRIEQFRQRFCDQSHLVIGLNPALPPIDRFDSGQDIGAGDIDRAKRHRFPFRAPAAPSHGASGIYPR